MGEMEEIVEFKTIKEDWNLYKLKDGSIVKTKFVLIKIRKPIYGTEGPVYNFSSTNIVGVICPKSLMGPPSPPTIKPLSDFIETDDVLFDTVKNEWNEYELEDGTIFRVKLVLVKASRTTRFDSGGSRIYLLNNQPLFKPQILGKATAEKGHPTFVT